MTEFITDDELEQVRRLADLEMQLRSGPAASAVMQVFHERGMDPAMQLCATTIMLASLMATLPEEIAEEFLVRIPDRVRDMAGKMREINRRTRCSAN